MMTEIDFKNKYKSYYSASESPEIVNIENAHYLSLLGHGSPGTTIFYEKKKAIKEFAQELQKKFERTEERFKSSVVEIFYWYDEEVAGFVDIGEFYTKVDLDLLHYRMAVRIPDFISEEDINMIAKKPDAIPFGNQFELFSYTAGKCVQMMHLGPLAGELVTLPILQKFATESGLIKFGMHHEIHLVNFEKGQSQEHLKTILRDPVRALLK